MTLLVDHLERRLGRMITGWSGQPRAGLPRFNVGTFTGGIIADTSSYSTLGLSNVPLHHPRSDRRFFLEFIGSAHGPMDASSGFFLAVLDYVWTRCVDSRQAVLRGDVIAIPDGLIPDRRFPFVYAALPVYYDDEFKSVVVENGDSVAIVWLVPITSGEAQIVFENGWRKFEEMLGELDPDLMAKDRPSIA